jgi:1-acyl-sn-glycerol-3-phosphate acyltransferase
MNALRGAWRLLHALLHALAGLATILWVFPRVDIPARHARVQAWARKMLDVLGIGLQVHGQPPRHGPVLLVANHISWLDILALGAVRPGRMVARADMRGWPLLGPVAARAGTIFVDRTRLSQLPVTVAQVRTALTEGATVLAFPEGTTWCGAAAGRFRPALFQAAIDAHAPVEPISLRYLAGGRTSTAPAFVGDDPLLASLWRVARTRGLVAEVRCHETLAPTSDRCLLATRAADAVRSPGLLGPC